ncbi:hypothetical protein TH53_00950 [Pedobacter lusitanus]|uniref:HTH araC/xylS-type domain-containing protein n=1 Tax=Pedobacter lusitanus TaxID=1503925 RepID=A0A0D0FAQ4_9SPHI|nr:helix-turn-helix transcriptional regulator [Pedobacter lusitanus]KIO78908.1 hypothetical protein TH53_00950 [Pedobacter lusitanus]
MDQYILTGIISFLSVFISFLFALFLLTVKTEHKLNNRLLACFIIFNGIDISGFFSYYFLQHEPVLEMFRGQTSLLIIPFFYLYVLSVCYADFSLKPKHLLHISPFLLANLIITPRFYLADSTARFLFLDNYNQMPEAIFLQIFILFQLTFYITAIFLVLRKYKKIYLENYTNPASVTYQWLFQFTCLLAAQYFIAALKNLLKYTDYTHIAGWVYPLVGLTALSVLCWFVLKALHHPDLFRGIDSKLKLVSDFIPDSPADMPTADQPASNLPDQDKITALRKFMEQEEPYLEPSLTIQDLAGQMKIQVRDLSILINHQLNQHFFDFINEYRIQKAMAILRDPRKNELNIQEVLYAVGFNSKSTFNFAFKKYTKQTPTQYRNSSLQTR